MRTQQWVKPILDALISPQKGGIVDPRQTIQPKDVSAIR